jgi:hypothetical protein
MITFTLKRKNYKDVKITNKQIHESAVYLFTLYTLATLFTYSPMYVADTKAKYHFYCFCLPGVCHWIYKYISFYKKGLSFSSVRIWTDKYLHGCGQSDIGFCRFGNDISDV